MESQERRRVTNIWEVPYICDSPARLAAFNYPFNGRASFLATTRERDLRKVHTYRRGCSGPVDPTLHIGLPPSPSSLYFDWLKRCARASEGSDVFNQAVSSQPALSGLTEEWPLVQDLQHVLSPSPCARSVRNAKAPAIIRILVLVDDDRTVHDVVIASHSSLTFRCIVTLKVSEL